MNENSFIRQYWSLICSGAIVVGEYIKMQMLILLDMLEDETIKKDFTEVSKRIKFIETECRHSEAPFAGKPFKLMLWEKVVIEALFVFYRYDEKNATWTRWFQELLLVIGRKNGKTPFVAAIALSEFVCGEMGTKILIGSNDYKQADLTFEQIDAMREQSEKISRCTRKSMGIIRWGGRKQKKKKGKFSIQNKGTINKISKKVGGKEGRNIRVGITDEIHEMIDNSLIMPIRQALSTQDNPLYIETTTEGFVDDGYLDQRLELATAVLKKESSERRFLIFWYAQDSEKEVWQNRQSWYKSNPSLGVVKKTSFLEQMVEESKFSSATKSFVLAKDFNIKQSSSEQWLDESLINSDTFDITMLQNWVYIGALDYAETTDLCNAKALFINPYTNKKYTLTHYFIPETKADAMADTETANTLNPEKINYKELAKKGLVTICPGTEVDAMAVAKWFWSLWENIKALPFKIGYDNWHAQDFKKIIDKMYGKNEKNPILERIQMDFLSLSGPMNSIENDLRMHRLNYNNNPLDKWCLRNTSIKTNNLGLIMPIKKYNQHKNRIDGALGTMIAYAAFSRFKSEYILIQKQRVKEDDNSGL